MKKIALIFSTLVAMTGVSQIATAEALGTGFATATIQGTITIDETTTVNFGSVAGGATTETCDMAMNGSLSGTPCEGGSGNTGNLRITGAAGQILTINLSTTAESAEDGVTFTPKLNANGDKTASGLQLDPVDGTLNIPVAGNIEIQGGAPSGLRNNMQYGIQVYYD